MSSPTVHLVLLEPCMHLRGGRALTSFMVDNVLCWLCVFGRGLLVVVGLCVGRVSRSTINVVILQNGLHNDGIVYPPFASYT